jgi:hypothetical protein
MEKHAALFLSLICLTLSSCGVRVYDCVKGADGIDAAVEFMADKAPNTVDNLQIFCDSEDSLQSISKCGRAKAKHIESCLMWTGEGPYSGRIYISHDEDAAISVCHELEHAVPEVWDTEDGCQSHEMSCNYDELEVAACKAAVEKSRAQSKK